MRFKSIHIAFENMRFSVQALVSNKLRTLLSVMGITVGIFCIILVLTFVDSLEKNIRDSVNSLGSDVIYVQKWPWTPEDGEYKWWEFIKRPVTRLSEMNLLKNEMAESRNAEHIAFFVNTNATAKYNGSTAEEVGYFGVSYDYNRINKFDILNGRYFSEEEMNSGRNTIILGYSVAEALFRGSDPVGKTITMNGRKYNVIGVMEKQGESIIGLSLDNVTLIPVQNMMKFMNVNRFNGDMAIMVKASENANLDELENEIRGKFRAIRKLRPKDKANFSLNKITLLSEGLNQAFGTIGIAGWVIGGFAIVVGGFGIYNIMFVSVNERTGQIGIQKSLGARRRDILLQFLTESVLLSLIGGLIGVGLVFLITLAGSGMAFPISLSAFNFILGTSLSVVIGIISGIIPAIRAAYLDPVEAIRTKL